MNYRVCLTKFGSMNTYNPPVNCGDRMHACQEPSYTKYHKSQHTIFLNLTWNFSEKREDVGFTSLPESE